MRKTAPVTLARRRRQAQVDEVGVQEQVIACEASISGEVLLAEARRRREAELEALEIVAGLADGQVRSLGGVREVEDGVGLGAVGVERRSARSASRRAAPSRASLEVDGLERAAPAAPVVRGAAEIAQAADVEVEILLADVGAAVASWLSSVISRPPASISATRGPAAARRRARVMPAGPAPITQTSKVRSKALRSAVAASASIGAPSVAGANRHGGAPGVKAGGFSPSVRRAVRSAPGSAESPTWTSKAPGSNVGRRSASR